MDSKNNYTFNAVCKDCGEIKTGNFDNTTCKCGGILHVDSARCLKCSKRHPFSHVGKKCNCNGDVVAKMVTCPACGENKSIDHLGNFCSKCNVQLRMEG